MWPKASQSHCVALRSLWHFCSSSKNHKVPLKGHTLSPFTWTQSVYKDPLLTEFLFLLFKFPVDFSSFYLWIWVHYYSIFSLLKILKNLGTVDDHRDLPSRILPKNISSSLLWMWGRQVARDPNMSDFNYFVWNDYFFLILLMYILSYMLHYLKYITW